MNTLKHILGHIMQTLVQMYVLIKRGFWISRSGYNTAFRVNIFTNQDYVKLVPYAFHQIEDTQGINLIDELGWIEISPNNIFDVKHKKRNEDYVNITRFDKDNAYGYAKKSEKIMYFKMSLELYIIYYLVMPTIYDYTNRVFDTIYTDKQVNYIFLPYFIKYDKYSDMFCASIRLDSGELIETIIDGYTSAFIHTANLPEKDATMTFGTTIHHDYKDFDQFIKYYNMKKIKRNLYGFSELRAFKYKGKIISYLHYMSTQKKAKQMYDAYLKNMATL